MTLALPRPRVRVLLGCQAGVRSPSATIAGHLRYPRTLPIATRAPSNRGATGLCSRCTLVTECAKGRCLASPDVPMYSGKRKAMSVDGRTLPSAHREGRRRSWATTDPKQPTASREADRRTADWQRSARTTLAICHEADLQRTPFLLRRIAHRFRPRVPWQSRARYTVRAPDCCRHLCLDGSGRAGVD